MPTNLSVILDTIGSLSTLYLLLAWALPEIENLYARHGAVVLIALYFLIRWLLQPAG